MGGVDEEDGAGVIAGFDLHFLHCACEGGQLEVLAGIHAGSGRAVLARNLCSVFQAHL